MAFAVLASLFSVASAQDEALALSLEAFRVVAEATADGGTELLEPAFVARPGDVIEWHLEARATGPDAILDVALDVPVPSDTLYVDASAQAAFLPPGEDAARLPGDAFLFSVDGGATFAPAPLVREVVTVVDGDEVTTEEPIPPSAVTHVRYPLPEVVPGATYLVSIRTEVP